MNRGSLSPRASAIFRQPVCSASARDVGCCERGLFRRREALMPRLRADRIKSAQSHTPDLSSVLYFDAEQTIFRESLEADRFYLIQSGRVALQIFIPGSGATTFRRSAPAKLSAGLGFIRHGDGTSLPWRSNRSKRRACVRELCAIGCERITSLATRSQCA